MKANPISHSASAIPFLDGTYSPRTQAGRHLIGSNVVGPRFSLMLASPLTATPSGQFGVVNAAAETASRAADVVSGANEYTLRDQFASDDVWPTCSLALTRQVKCVRWFI